jgi:alpha-ketoglutarate-dependent taurine dioxygenase
MNNLESALATAAALPEAAERPGFPYVYRPEQSGQPGQLLRWVEQHEARLKLRLSTVGAVLLRETGLDNAQDFAQVAAQLVGPLDGRYQGPSPRKRMAEGVFSASEVGGSLSIPEHAELSYMAKMPRFLLFWCREPARLGGETTLVDGRRVLARLTQTELAPLLGGPLRIRRRHAPAHGLRDPFELSRWPDVFGTRDPEALAAQLAVLRVNATIERSGALTLHEEQPAVRVHPISGERVWLNHLLVFHASAPAALLASAARQERMLRALLGYPIALAYRRLSERLGRAVATDVRLHDGSPIADETVSRVRAVVQAEAHKVAWQRGDLLIVDNHLVLHGRRPYRGRRQVVVAWSRAQA